MYKILNQTSNLFYNVGFTSCVTVYYKQITIDSSSSSGNIIR